MVRISMLNRTYLSMCILFLLATGANRVYANDLYFRFQASCDRRIPSQESNIKFQEESYVVDSSKDLSEVSAMSKRSSFYSITYGLTVVTPKIDVKSNLRFFRPHSDFACGKVSITGTISLSNHVIYIANEYPPGTCEYEQILKHEHAHAELNVNIMRSIEKELNAHVNENHHARILFAPQNNFETSAILENVAARFRSLWRSRSVAHAEIDRLMTWEKTLEACRIGNR